MEQKISQPALALRKKVSVKEAAALNDIHEDTFRRNYGHLIKKVSPRRRRRRAWRRARGW